MIQRHGRDDTTEDSYVRSDVDVREYMTIEESKLLYMPLPMNLPTVRKDPFTQMAAYEGNIDQYARLMRPNVMSRLGLACVV